MGRINLVAIQNRLGMSTASKGEQYFQSSRVGPLNWYTDAALLTAAVSGNQRWPYETDLHMVMHNDRPVDLDFGKCSCPVGFDCKHVYAVLLQAVHDTSTKLQPAYSAPVVQHWSHSLSALRKPVDPLYTGAATQQFGVQLTLSAPADNPPYFRLSARPVKLSERGAWVTSGLSWDRLPHGYSAEAAAQIAVLREIHALSLVKSRRHNSYYYSQGTASIQLSEISGRLLWDLLDDAVEHGVALVNSRKSLGQVTISQSARFDIDVTALPSTELSVTGRTFIGDTPIDRDQVGLLGPDGTGIVHWDADAPADVSLRQFGLARLDTPLPSALHSIATAPTPLLIPKAERSIFANEYLPALRLGASVVSSDESYHPPVVLGPELRVNVVYSAGHRVTTDAEWRYRIDESEILIPADRPMIEDGTRDTSAETAILDAVRAVLGGGRVPKLVLPPFTVQGMAAAHYLTDSVPQLRAIENLQIEVSGEPPSFADVSNEIAVSLSTRAVNGDNDWFDLGVVVTVDGANIPLSSMITAVACGDSHLLLPDGRYFDLHSPTLAKLRELIDEARSLQDAPDGPLRLSRYQAGLWEELAALGVVTRQAKAWRAQVSGLLALDGVEPAGTPSGLEATLRSYQGEGLSWLSFLYEHGLGGILADDMGLGKTIQTLALITRVQETSGISAPFLIVAPSSVVHNWAREAQRFTPGLKIATAAETALRRGTTIDKLAGGADIVITSYTIFRLDFDDFDSVTWSGLILDEAQYVKNHQAKSYQCARLLSAPFKLAITGTPMENNVMELWSLLSIAAPGLFPSPKKFTDLYRKPIEQGGDTAVLEQLRRRIKPLVLRRTKDLVVADLPPKQEQTVEVDLHPRHRKLYDTTLNRERQKILGLIDDLDKNRFTILKSLTLLRQLSLDPTLVDEKHATIPSAKTAELVAQLTAIAAGGHRALVFSQFTRYLGRVRDRLSAEGIEFEYLDGKTSNRAAVVERFREGDASVFLISLKAGGVGLTLTEADYCFVLDPWWNPATEMQAVDRAHRIGQTKTVFVNRYVSRGTIEEKVMALKERKAKLIAGVMDNGTTFDGGLTADDIRALIE